MIENGAKFMKIQQVKRFQYGMNFVKSDRCCVNGFITPALHEEYYSLIGKINSFAGIFYIELKCSNNIGSSLVSKLLINVFTQRRINIKVKQNNRC